MSNVETKREKEKTAINIILTSDITVRPIQHMGGDHMVVAAARVSTHGEAAERFADPSKAEECAGLISYLMQHRHGTPFEHSALSLFVHAPIFVFREWHRHRIGHSYNEESARYKTLDPVFYIAPKDRPIHKVENWKAGRPKFEEYGALVDEVNGRNAGVYEAAYKAYLANLESGADPGIARACLPVGIFSSCWVTVNPRSLMAFISLRTHDPDARQVSYPLYEIEVAARAAEKVLADIWPLTYAAFCKHGRVAP